jgi:hypothetical protein
MTESIAAPQTTETDVLIVGAGITGLMAAQLLTQHGLRVTLIEKNETVGGRLATELIGPGRADYGAQFFTIRSPEFGRWVEQWLAAGLVYRWSSGWSDGSLAPLTFDGHPRYAVHQGMAHLAQHLAQGADLHCNMRLAALTVTASGWQAANENHQLYTSRAALLTPPVPQALDLLTAGQVILSPNDRAALARITYLPCLCGLFWVEGPTRLPTSGAVQRPQAPISWVADNQRKGISPQATVITAHTGPTYSRHLWEASPDKILKWFEASLQSFLPPPTLILKSILKRWHYATPTALHPKPYLLAEGLPPLIFAGDAFGEARVEGATLSGLAAAETLYKTLAR